jgi:hypothetical protein
MLDIQNGSDRIFNRFDADETIRDRDSIVRSPVKPIPAGLLSKTTYITVGSKINNDRRSDGAGCSALAPDPNIQRVLYKNCITMESCLSVGALTAEKVD